jgi:Domain of Unknown Function (DUF748)
MRRIVAADNGGMAWATVSRRWWIVLGVALAIFAALLVALRVVAARLPVAVADALGPHASVGAIEPGWMSIEVRDLVVRADPKRWPAEFELRASRVTLRPEWSSLWRRGWRLAHIEVEGGYLSMQRLRDGRLVVLPSLLRDRQGDGGATPLRIGTLALRGATIDFFDATVAGGRGAPHRLRLTSLDAEAGPLALPALDERMRLSIATTLDGPKHDGTLRVTGHLTPAAREADLDLRARGVDLVALQPYLLKSGEASVRGGTMDLTIDAKASGQRLHAPGQLTLHRLELSEGGGLSTFAGLPRQAVLAAMSRDGKIELSFTLEGRVDDPKFSINELFAARFAVGLADKLGVSLSGVVEGVGNVIKGLLGR